MHTPIYMCTWECECACACARVCVYVHTKEWFGFRICLFWEKTTGVKRGLALVCNITQKSFELKRGVGERTDAFWQCREDTRVFAYVYAFTHTHTHAHTCTHTRTNTNAQAHTHACTLTHTLLERISTDTVGMMFGQKYKKTGKKSRLHDLSNMVDWSADFLRIRTHCRKRTLGKANDACGRPRAHRHTHTHALSLSAGRRIPSNIELHVCMYTCMHMYTKTKHTHAHIYTYTHTSMSAGQDDIHRRIWGGFGSKHRLNYRSLLQKSPTKETVFCKRDL